MTPDQLATLQLMFDMLPVDLGACFSFAGGLICGTILTWGWGRG